MLTSSSLRAGCNLPAPQNDGYSRQHHQYAKNLTHRIESQNKSKVCIRFAEKLDEETNQTVTENIKTNGETVERIFFSDGPEDTKQKQTLKQSLIKL